MKTLTVTFHHTCNYGATLQTYALHQVIKSLGHDNIVFEYPEENRKCKPFLKSPYEFTRTQFQRMCYLLRKDKIDSRVRLFKEFHADYIPKTRVYRDMDDLRNNAPKVDCLITGSDQVWNMNSLAKFKPAHFLDFGPSDIIRFSYAASIEKLNYTEQQKDYVAKAIASYKGVSLRETSARDYINSFTNADAIQVVDPVFLLNKQEWDSISTEGRIKEPYILCYQVSSNPLMQKMANYLKEKTGCKIVSVCHDTIKWIKSDYSLFDVSPKEFLGLYKNANFVLTTSFHGTALALVYERPFISLVRSDSRNRIVDLLNLLGLEKSCVSSTEEFHVPDIDYSSVRAIIEVERSRSLDYLKRMLSE